MQNKRADSNANCIEIDALVRFCVEQSVFVMSSFCALTSHQFLHPLLFLSLSPVLSRKMKEVRVELSKKDDFLHTERGRDVLAIMASSFSVAGPSAIKALFNLGLG